MAKNLKTSKSDHKISEHDARRTKRTSKDKEKERLENLVPSFIESSSNERHKGKTSNLRDVPQKGYTGEAVNLNKNKPRIQPGIKTTSDDTKKVSSQKHSNKLTINSVKSDTGSKIVQKKTSQSRQKITAEKSLIKLKASSTSKTLSQKDSVKKVPSNQLNSSISSSKKVKKTELKKHDTSNKPSQLSQNTDSSESYVRPTTSTLKKGSVVLENVNNYALNANESFENLKQKSDIEASDHSDASSYEEDFEDYDSDFENSDEDSVSENKYSSSDSDNQGILQNDEQDIKALQINSEPQSQHDLQHEKVHSTSKKPEKTFLKMSDRKSLISEKNIQPSFDSSLAKMSHSFINFASAVEKEAKEKSTNRVLKRASELLDIITLDENSFDLINIPPMKYDVYIRTFGRLNTKQAFVQSENYEDESVQTDYIDLKEKWTQYPPSDEQGSGGSENIDGTAKTLDMELLFSVKDVKLTSFLQNASALVIDLLNERFSTFNEKQVTNRRKNLFYSEGYYILSPLIKGVPVTNLSFSVESSHYIISVHDSISKLPESFNFPENKGVICVWNILDSEKPESVLVTNSQPVCACFGPGSNTIIIAGMVDGSVMLWDLTELSSRHSHLEMDDGPVTLRSPTYNTASVLGSDNHHSCIVAVQVVNNWSNEKFSSKTRSNSDYTKNFHVFTLEDMGVLNIWVVIEILKPDISGLGSDLGLSPGGKLRLVRSSSIILHSLQTLNQDMRTGIRTFDFRIVPSDSNRILVTTDIGLILHVARHEGDTDPRFYSGEFECASDIRCIDCSPHNDHLFLVGCSDGSARLHSIHSVRPLMTFPQVADGESVITLQWSTIHPSVFCVLSSTSQLYFWDLIQNVYQPVYNYHFADARVTWFTLCGSVRNSSQMKSQDSLNLLISKDNGEIEVHVYQKKVDEKEYSLQLDFMQHL